ncbi:Clp protease N-terminal domain-containing protein [Hyphomicrobium sp. 99]|uniref:Clp protease N-terminal domain-containing protein n=1 Tax=Hyphomicrobium sp. 99 TaxID=1163419 RepID=UPI0005F7B4B5|nr:Clp protease N-terminal domain-containing protein [Hyphomicrobium sp. 99]
MAYHGEDLDLRTQQTWTPADVIPGETSLANGKRGPLHAGPVLVDDTVLACFNQAYDIASAHRSGDVRIEHLLNAMTRVDQAAAALEAHGVRVVALKRETAAIIAGDIPAVSGGGAVSPRRSDELAELLRLASSFAARRNAAVSIDDLLHVLLDQRSDIAQSELLFRFSSRYAPMPEPLPPLTRAEGRYQPSALRYSAEYTRPSYRNDYLGAPADAFQNSRIEALEQTVRALSQDFSNERHILAGLIRDLSRDTLAHQEDQGRGQAVLFDRIGALEAALREGGTGSSETLPLISKLENIEAGLELRLQEMSQSWAVLSTRLQELEASVKARPASEAAVVDLKPIADRLDIIEEAVLGHNEHRGLGEVTDRLSKLDDDIGRVLATATEPRGTEGLLGGFDRIDGLSDKLEKIDGLSNKLDTHNGALTELSVALIERMNAVERAVEAEIETAAAKHQAYTHDLTEVHEALLKVNENQHTLAGSMDQWRSESATDVANILNRLETIDRDAGLPAETLAALNNHMEATNRFIIERYHRRHRFMYWLFGTDDWISASWPSTKATIDAEERRLKEAGA